MSDGFYMDRVISPARAFPRGARYAVLACAMGMGLIPVAIFTVFFHAPLVLPFMGLDIAGLAFAMWVVSRRVTIERVRVSRETLEVFKDGTPVWTSPLATTDIRATGQAIELALPGQSYRLAATLPAQEREQFAAALSLAIIAAKAGSQASRGRRKARS